MAAGVHAAGCFTRAVSAIAPPPGNGISVSISTCSRLLPDVVVHVVGWPFAPARLASLRSFTTSPCAFSRWSAMYLRLNLNGQAKGSSSVHRPQMINRTTHLTLHHPFPIKGSPRVQPHLASRHPARALHHHARDCTLDPTATSTGFDTARIAHLFCFQQRSNATAQTRPS